MNGLGVLTTCHRLGWVGAVLFATLSSCDKGDDGTPEGVGGSNSAGSGEGGRGGSGQGGGAGDAGSGGSGGSVTTCDSDNDCRALGKLCDPDQQICVTCVFDVDCDAGQRCRGGECEDFTPCENSLDCPKDKVCDEATQECVECLTNSDCPDNNDCIDQICVPFTPCENSLDCPDAQVCDKLIGRCVGCVLDADCKDEERCVDNTCRPPCDSDNDCKDLDLLCDIDAGYCVQCLEHTDCPDDRYCNLGVCHPDLCEAGDRTCQGNAVAECSAAGDGFGTPALCPEGETCVASGSDAECKPPDPGDCGNSTIEAGEQCDDGNSVVCDACESCELRQTLTLDGASSSYVEIGDAAGAPLKLLGVSFTVEAWVKLDGLDNGVLVMRRGSTNTGWAFRALPTSIHMTVFGDASLGFDHTLSVSLVDSGWRHVAWTYDRLTSSIFLDGVLSSSQSQSQAAQESLSPLRFGADIGPFGTIDAYKSGKIDELRVSKIKRYLADFASTRRFDADNDTLALWHFDEGSGTQVLDVSQSLHRGQVLGGTIGWVNDDGYGGKFCTVSDALASR